jgi:dimethylargininase
MEVMRIEEPGTLDGGDVLQVDDVVYVGRTRRTNDAGIAQLERAVATRGRKVVQVAVPGALHLKTAATALPDGSILTVSRWVDTDAFRGRRLHEAPDPTGADVLVVNGVVVLAASASRTASYVEDLGFDVQTIDISELEKAEAGPTCPSVLLPALPAG